MTSERIESLFMQCGRIHKDAEIRLSDSDQSDRIRTFNVAASIKMRKSCHHAML